jgi:hypothetical protein
MSSSIAVTCTSLLYLLTIEFYVVAYVYTLLSKPVISVSLASRTAYEIISYLVTKCVIEVRYLYVIILSFYVSVGNLFLKVRVEGYKGLVFSLAYRV